MKSADPLKTSGAQPNLLRSDKVDIVLCRKWDEAIAFLWRRSALMISIESMNLFFEMIVLFYFYCFQNCADVVVKEAL